MSPAAVASSATEVDRREAILAAALELFAERGFHGTAVPQIAERAGVAAGTIYRYFEGKEALVNAVYQKWKNEMGRALIDGFPMDVPVREQFHAFWQRMAVFAAEHRTAIMFLELHHHAPYLDDKSRSCEENVLGAARAFFAETQRQQVIKDIDPEVLIALVYGGFVTLLKGAWVRGIELGPEILDAAEGCMWEAIRR